MKKNQHITAFYLETLLMIVVFISIILVLTRVFGSARVQSVGAKHLTAAVTLAQNTAEAVSASSSPQELAEILDEGGNVFLQEGGTDAGPRIMAAYDAEMNPVALAQEAEILSEDGGLFVETAWNQDTAAAGGLVDAVITVFNRRSGEPVYSLQTAVYLH